MPTELLSSLVDILRVGGPWAILVVLGWAYMRKDKECRASYLMLKDLSVKQTEATTSLKDAIGQLSNTLTLFLNRK